MAAGKLGYDSGARTGLGKERYKIPSIPSAKPRHAGGYAPRVPKRIRGVVRGAGWTRCQWTRHWHKSKRDARGGHERVGMQCEVDQITHAHHDVVLVLRTVDCIPLRELVMHPAWGTWVFTPTLVREPSAAQVPFATRPSPKG